MWKLDYELMIYCHPEGSQPAADFPNELPTLCAHNTVENLQRSGWLAKFIKPAIQLLMPYCRLPRQPACHINGLEWEKYRTLLATVLRRENWGTTFLNR